jgi:hypothetical protein
MARSPVEHKRVLQIRAGKTVHGFILPRSPITGKRHTEVTRLRLHDVGSVAGERRGGARNSNNEDDMRTYEIRYVDSDGNLIGAIFTAQPGGRQASVFAHAMTLRPYERLEVWENDTLIYQRPFGAPATVLH